MSVEEHTVIYLRCDTIVEDVRCTATYPFHRSDGYAPTRDALEVLVRHAVRDGWRAEARYEGLAGWGATATCPDHAAETAGEA